MSIPRDFRCWYCAQGEHLRCRATRTCRCYTCYATEIKQEDRRETFLRAHGMTPDKETKS
jgi:hypothetical protein